MLASLLFSVLCLAALQVFLVVKVADWLSARPKADDDRSREAQPAGRYVGIA